MVAAGVAVLVALPAVIAALPPGSSKITAAALLARIQHSANVPYSGYAEATGGLSLPVTRQFSSVADLLGQTTHLRVWYRGGTDWRVDTITLAGESDVHAGPTGTWTWDYEDNRATWTAGAAPPDVRLPASGDVVPTNLARRLLSQATPDQVHRLGSRRIAGRSVPGLRLTPSEPGSTIERVDVWADERTGLALRVDVYGGGTTVMSSRFLDFSTRRPASHDTAFTPPDSARVRTFELPDLAAEIDRYGGTVPPATLAGLTRNPFLPMLGAIGVYGRGVTELVAVPLPLRAAYALQRQLAGTAVKKDGGLALTVGPLNLLATGSWLLAGTVEYDRLGRAAAQLAEVP